MQPRMRAVLFACAAILTAATPRDSSFAASVLDASIDSTEVSASSVGADPVDWPATVAAPSTARVLILSQNVGEKDCVSGSKPSQVDFAAKLANYRTNGANGACAHDIFIISVQEVKAVLTGSQAHEYKDAVMNTGCGISKSVLEQNYDTDVTTSGSGTLGKAVYTYIIAKKAFLVPTVATGLRNIVSDRSLYTPTMPGTKALTKVAVIKSLRFCGSGAALGTSRNEKNKCAAGQCRVDFIGAHLGMKSDHQSIFSSGEGGTFEYGLDLRDTGMSLIQAYRKTTGMKDTDPAFLTGDLNYRIDNTVGEQLRRRLTVPMNGGTANPYAGWAEGNAGSLPNYYTCRFSPYDKTTNKVDNVVAATYGQCREGADTFALVPGSAGDTVLPNGGIGALLARRVGTYPARERACGVGAKDAKNRPFSYCDRVIYNPGVAVSNVCPFVMAPTYNRYESIYLCPLSDHNAVVADVTIAWTRAVVPAAVTDETDE